MTGAGSSSSSKGSTVLTLSPFGCIKANSIGNVKIMTPTITRFVTEKIVWLVEIASTTAPPVCVTNVAPPVASVNGIDPDNPACQIKNPLYAAATSNG